MALPLLLLHGPFGAGKTTVAIAIRDMFGFLHLGIEHSPKDGLQDLRREWDSLWGEADAHPLADTLRRRAATSKASGVVVTVPSGAVPTNAHLSAMLAEGMTPIVLYGTGADCLEAFVARERSGSREDGIEEWMQNSAYAYAAFSEPRFAPYRLNTFIGGRFRTLHRIASEARKRAVLTAQPVRATESAVAPR